MAATSLAQVKLYGDALALAIIAAGNAYLASQPPPSDEHAAMVHTIVSELSTARAVLAEAQPAENPREVLTEIITATQKLSAITAPHLGKAAPYLPLALAVIQTFIDSLPPPVAAPEHPPAELHEHI